MYPEITIPTISLICLVIICCALASLALVFFAYNRYLTADHELYIETHKGECDVPASALRGKESK